jgi:hypothetical protein
MNRRLQEPFADAKKALKQFPNICDPGAEKILLFGGSDPDCLWNQTVCEFCLTKPSL